MEEPDPYAVATYTEDNPHLNTTTSLPPTDAEPTRLSQNFTRGDFPLITLSESDQTDCINQRAIEENEQDPTHLHCLVHYAGAHVFENDTQIHKEVERFINNLEVRRRREDGTHELREDAPGITVLLPASTLKAKATKEGMRPWPMTITGGTEAEREYLVTLWSCPVYKRTVDKIFLPGSTSFGFPAPANLRERVILSTTSLQLIPTQFSEDRGQRRDVLHLTARPLTEHPVAHAQWIRAMGLEEYFSPAILAPLNIERAFKRCLECKSKMHPTGDCPFPKLAGWHGPDANSNPFPLASQTATNNERPRGKPTRGGKAQRGRNRRQ